MIGWTLFGVWFVGWHVFTVVWARTWKEEDIARVGLERARRDQRFTLFTAWIVAIGWPLVLILYPVYIGVVRLSRWVLYTKTERRLERERCAAEVREQARQLGLKWPEAPRG